MKALLLLLLVLACGVSTILLNLQFMSVRSPNSNKISQVGVTSTSSVAESSLVEHGAGNSLRGAAPDKVKRDSEPHKVKSNSEHSLAGLSCEAHGGPSDELASEMVYWKDIPSDSDYVSPYSNYGPEVKYLTVEPDEGFWNNKRMAIESAIVLAVATGRTLVLPPKQDLIYDEIFHFASVAEESAFRVITTEEFLTREGLTGNLKDENGNVVFPPENSRVNWDGDMRMWWGEGQPLWQYLRSVSYKIPWEKDRCVAVIPDKPGPEGEARVQEYADQIIKERMHELIRIEGYTNNPTPVDAPPIARLREMMATRKQICVYNEEMQNAKYLHAMGDNGSEARFFSHFYALLFFEDWRQDIFLKRFIRDHFRYADELQCAAARVIHEVREIAKRNALIGDGEETSNPAGNYDSFHVRRGDFLDFQQGAQVDGEQIYQNTRSVLEEGGTIYIATDEPDKSFFDPLRKHGYKLYFLDDFQHLLGGIPMHKFGMLDQLVASRGRTFVGLYYSTFTGYINRMRAYHAQKDKLPGYEDGAVPSYFYAERRFKYWLRQYRPLSWPLWKTEFPVAWRDIDHDLLPTDLQ